MKKSSGKKSSGKGKPASKRGVKDLAPRKTQDVKGGKASIQGFNVIHYFDKTSQTLT